MTVIFLEGRVSLLMFLFRLIPILAAGISLFACRQAEVVVTTPPATIPTVVGILSPTENVAMATGHGPGTNTPLSATATSLPALATEHAATQPAQNPFTRTPFPTASPRVTLAPSATSAPSATATDAPPPTTQTTPTPTPLSHAPIIQRFELVAQEEMNPGKRLTFSWSGEGASATLIAGTRRRFIPWWSVPLSGTITIELENTLFRDPEISLSVFGPQTPDGTAGPQVTETIVIPWPCEHDYFFSPVPERCPRDAAAHLSAAQQRFEGGRMVWLQSEGKILVLFDAAAAGFDESQLRVYEDTWTEREPESDPSIVPPADRFQPVRGFGKVWRESPEVRNGLGWALQMEAAFNTTWQFEFNESIGTTSYLRLVDGRIVRLTGYYVAFGTWSYLDS